MKPIEERDPDYALVDYSKIKDFLNWGMNRALSDLRLRRMVDVKLREERMKRKPEHDWTKIMITVIVIIMIGGIGFVLMQSFFNFSDLQTGLGQCIADQGALKAQLNICEANLENKVTGQLMG